MGHQNTQENGLATEFQFDSYLNWTESNAPRNNQTEMYKIFGESQR